MVMSLVWDKISDWLTWIGIALFGLGAAVLIFANTFAVGVGVAAVLFLLSVVLQAFGIAAEYEALRCLEEEKEDME